MDFKNIGKMLAKNGLKLLGKSLPIGGDIVSELICKTLNLDNKEDIEEALKSPDNILKLKQLESDEKITLLKLSNENTVNARDMNIETSKSNDIFIRRFPYFLAGGWSLFSAVFIFFATFWNIPSDNLHIVNTIVGFLMGTIISTIINFFFGSSEKNINKGE